MMNSLQRFFAAMGFGKSDRVPFFEEGIREDVIRSWRSQGMPSRLDLPAHFSFDYREETDINLEPIPYPRRWPQSVSELDGFLKRLDHRALNRIPKNWHAQVNSLKSRDFPLILRMHEGFFLSLGVDGWKRFYDAINLIFDQPALVMGILEAKAELSSRLMDQMMSEVEFDAVLFSEPIGGNHGSLISPSMYRKFMIPGYRMIMDTVKKYRVPIVIMRTYANTRVHLPDWVSMGVNCLWAVETPHNQDMDYQDIRREFGSQLRLIGGIDVDALLGNQDDILRALEMVPELLGSVGYIPLLNGRVRSGVTWANYSFYRQKLAEICAGSRTL